MTEPQSPVPAASTAAAIPAVGTGTHLPRYTVVDDDPLLDRMLANVADNEAILAAVKAHHTWDESGPLMTSFAHLAGISAEAAAEILHLRRMLGGGS